MASDRTAPLPPLGEVELAVLDHLWRAGDSDVGATHAAIGARRGVSPNTIGSALERLFRKGLVARDKVSYSYRYRATLDREAFQARKLVDAAGGLRALSDDGLLAAFVDLVAETDEEALAALERLVAAKRAGRKP